MRLPEEEVLMASAKLGKKRYLGLIKWGKERWTVGEYADQGCWFGPDVDTPAITFTTFDEASEWYRNYVYQETGKLAQIIGPTV